MWYNTTVNNFVCRIGSAFSCPRGFLFQLVLPIALAIPSKVLDRFFADLVPFAPFSFVRHVLPVVSTQHAIDYHTKYFEKLAKDLNGSFSKCIVSFIDIYINNAKRCAANGLNELSNIQMYAIAKHIANIARKNNFSVVSCAENIDLNEFGIEHSSCIDKELIEHLIRSKIVVHKDKNQREECWCVESIDIGSYILVFMDVVIVMLIIIWTMFG